MHHEDDPCLLDASGVYILATITLSLANNTSVPGSSFNSLNLSLNEIELSFIKLLIKSIGIILKEDIFLKLCKNLLFQSPF